MLRVIAYNYGTTTVLDGTHDVHSATHSDHHHHRIMAVTLAPCRLCGGAGRVWLCGQVRRRSSVNASAGIEFADCMRSHGVPSFPDPGGGGGIQITAGSGINPQSPAFQSAQSACLRLLPGGGPGGGRASESQKVAMLKLSECMRGHGFLTFPDPTSTAPSPGSGFALAFGRPGSVIAIPRSLVQSPAFNQAAAACHLPGAGPAERRRHRLPDSGPPFTSPLPRFDDNDDSASAR
ncbi:MAG: hypothetical protein ABSG43_19125 [Solirubrobacteraceae bacterium]